MDNEKLQKAKEKFDKQQQSKKKADDKVDDSIPKEGMKEKDLLKNIGCGG